MPTLVCRACGRIVYATSPLEALFPEERRCPRCGAALEPERRGGNRRLVRRRQDGPEAPGLPKDAERRVADRRQGRRRHDDHGPSSS